jgi:transcriptional regulator with XRE-family HTH domain
MTTPDESAVTSTRRQELSRFLRQKRRSIDPSSVGLTPGVRRRSRGLTQVDVARLAGVERRTYQLFELGMVRPTAAVFAAFVAALRLTPAETNYLRNLADMTRQVEPCPAPPTVLVDEVRPLMAGIRGPALVYDASFTLLAWNDALVEMFPHLDGVEPSSINLVRYLFTVDEPATVFVDLAQVQREAIGRLRASRVRCADPTFFDALMDELCAVNPAAQRLWTDETVQPFEPSLVSYLLRHPDGTVHTVPVATVGFVDDMPVGLRMAYALSGWVRPS